MASRSLSVAEHLLDALGERVLEGLARRASGSACRGGSRGACCPRRASSGRRARGGSARWTGSWRPLPRVMSIPSAISSTVGSRPSSCSSAVERLPMRCSVPARFSGTRTMRLCSASACRIAWRIHQTAYEMNLMPLVSSNLCAARMRPRLPSLIRSARRHALVLVLLGDGDDEAQVGAHQLVERFRIGLLDADCASVDLVFAADQRVRADLAEVLIERAFVRLMSS